MKLQRGFSTLGCAELEWEAVVALAARHGLEAVELRALGGTVDLPQFFAARYGTPRELAARFSGSAVSVVALDTSFKLVGGSPAEREALLDFVPWAEAAGAKYLRVFDGESGAEPGAAADAVGWWRERRRAGGWRVDWMVETHDTLTTAAAIGRFAAAAPACGILWDSHHTWKKGGEDPVATWEAIAPHVVHVHVKDSVSRPSARHPFTYVLPGEGDFPMAPLVERLRGEFAGVVSLEWERLWHPYLPPLDEALRVAEARRWW
jgi:sugar phosphate isomerase/epimerase